LAGLAVVERHAPDGRAVAVAFGVDREHGARGRAGRGDGVDAGDLAEAMEIVRLEVAGHESGARPAKRPRDK
jgi:hypothetical protein